MRPVHSAGSKFTPLYGKSVIKLMYGRVCVQLEMCDVLLLSILSSLRLRVFTLPIREVHYLSLYRDLSLIIVKL